MKMHRNRVYIASCKRTITQISSTPKTRRERLGTSKVRKDAWDRCNFAKYDISFLAGVDCFPKQN